MSNGRIYSAQFDGVAESAAHDVFEFTTASNHPIEILSFHLSQLSVTGDAAEELLLVQFKTGMTTSGSGGATVVAVPRLLDEVGSGTTIKYTNTTQASGGTIVTRWSTYWNIRFPLDVWWPPEQPLHIKGGTGGTFSIDTTPAGSTTFSATCVYREL